MTWTLAKGHKGPVKGLCASGPQGLDPLFTHYSTLPSVNCQDNLKLFPAAVVVTRRKKVVKAEA